MSCTHERYTGYGYMPVGEAMRSKEICWTGMIVKECEDCAADISSLRIVPVKTTMEYMESML